jgi:cellulose synthase/poly-beta-1,6-N-acetylglucosamine synthase-like glycosyltransferase
MNGLSGLFVLLALATTLPAAILLLECVAALWPRRAGDTNDAALAADLPRVALLIPAHDEQEGVAATVSGLRPEIGPGDRIIVIADNCTDATAARARAAGAEVIERNDPGSRGKGFAIQFGLEHLSAAPPDVVLLVDADCRLGAGRLAWLAAIAARTGRPVQAEYLLAAPDNPGGIATVNALAVLVRNQVRPRGLHRLGFPCHLTGSGMAFPWRVLREAAPTGGNLVEDLVMGIDMAKRGHPPLLCPKVQVRSELPAGRGAAMKQRRRWEHGQLQTLLGHGGSLLVAGLRQRQLALIGLGLDVLVPPLALLVGLQGMVLALALAAGALGLDTRAAVTVMLTGLGAVGLGVLLAWLRFGRQTIPARSLLFAPLYLLWKIPLYLSLITGRAQRTWERTDRAPRAGMDPPGQPPAA